MSKILKENKSINSVIAVTLMLGVTIIGFILVKSSYIYYTSNLIGTFSEENSKIQSLKIEGIIKDEIYLINNLNYNQNISKLIINNNNCDITGYEILVTGINKINISDCLGEDKIADTLLVLEDNVFRGTFSVLDN
jgi:hypothetical protein